MTIIREVLKGIRKACQLIEMCDGHVGGAKGFGEV